ncbi:T3SS (YopN, CesT) and YbjN peptide-binding chaperone 1 [Rhodococcus marinonascens]|uniref:T3SS (YopN, CesT) and YbjN peptide-binding chaperone 1 n=1 Tax=Rhodococcus marinonascens TaxID=38311 RepID=UPI000932AF8D|nr:hypothetical protein [Rhodococcus marinonascens]
MPGLDDFDYDRSVQRAWSAFRRLLSDHVAEMQVDDLLILDSTFDTDRDAVPRCVQFLAWAPDTVRCEVPSNHFLVGNRSLAAVEEARLVDLGWNPPTCTPGEPAGNGSPAFWVDKPASWADQLAAMTVIVFRELWGVPHPVFLAPKASGTVSTPVFSPPGPTAASKEDLDLFTSVVPRDPEHLRDLISRTIIPRLKFTPKRDDDGDLILPFDQMLAFIWPAEHEPTICISVPLVHDITNRTRAAELVSDFNRKWRYFRPLLLNDRLYAVADVMACPFVPNHLPQALKALGDILRGVDEDFAERFGGRSPLSSVASASNGDEVPNEEDEDDEGLPRALVTLMHLDPHDTGDLNATEVAEICGNDRDQILEFLRLSSEQEISWRISATEADSHGGREEAAACNHEANAWNQTVESLRTALRVVALPNGTPGTPSSGWAAPQMKLFDIASEPTLFDASPDS